ncbi:MAG TPA: hypothetical protein VE263_10805 [Candidatus Angelobacter sp.]|nr:hypothetical protein [Candidatus Angelobacter sp.]
MKCEEFEAMGLDAGRDASLSEAERAAAAEHVNACPRCAALENSWQAARVELCALAEDTAEMQAPARVEMRLRQEFRTRHRTLKVRRTAVAAAWALAAAAVIVGAVSWVNWRGTGNVAKKNSGTPAIAGNPGSNNSVAGVNQDDGSLALVADNEAGDFTLLPGVLAADTDDSSILRVRMQRGALGAFGLPVNEDLANEWIQVDLLVGDDGEPQAVRLLQE